MPYAQLSDVNNLIGAVISAADISTQQINTEIAASSKYIEKKCNQTFYARKVRYNQDGQNAQIMLSTVTPIINVNQIEIFNYNLLGLHSVLFDFQLQVNRETGVISYPITNNNIEFAPNVYFFAGVQNIRCDVQAGYTQTIYDETMATKDNITYKFANPNVINFTEMPGPNSVQPPLISPCIYVDGVYQQNRIYGWETLNATSYLGAVNEPYAQQTWMVDSDNLIYTTNSTSSGITSITFNAALPSSAVVTVMYRYAEIPDDITAAVAKHASINLLRSTATGIYQDLQFMGVDQIMDNSARLMSNTGRFESQISGFLSDVAETIVANKSTNAGIVGNSCINPIAGSFSSWSRF